MARVAYVYKVVGKVHGTVTYRFEVAAASRDEALAIAADYIALTRHGEAVRYEAEPKMLKGEKVAMVLADSVLFAGEAVI